ncbi:MAG: hypothetical protein U0572_13435 [Phycisphaerales bacterium]
MNARNVAIVGALLITGCVIPCSCQSNKSSENPSRSQVLNARAPIASYRSQLDQIRPRINETIASASNMLIRADTDPKGAIDAFETNLGRLRGDVQNIRAQVDELQRLGFDQYFLGANRTTAVTSDPAVTSARERYGMVGDYMTSLRNNAQTTLGLLDEISAAVTKNPTSAGIQSVSSQIRRLAPAQIELNSVIDHLTQAIDTMPRA